MRIPISPKVILSLIVISTFVSCKTQDPDVAQSFQKQAPAIDLKSPNYSEFLNNVKGTYIIDSSKNKLIVDMNGSFTIENTSYSIHEVLVAHQAIYVAATRTEDGKTLYTYHGIQVTDFSINTVSYKNPAFTKHREILPHESEHAWEINTFRPENINWSSGFLTTLAQKEREIL